MLKCPKCQRPLEDETDGVYICCAGSPLQWRCSRCAKVSEGFAFPCGQCPHCGGKLALTEEEHSADVTAMAGIRIAFEIELGGRAFYQRASAQSTDPDMRALFSRFAVMEGEHMETLSRRYHVDVPSPSPSFRIEQAAIFSEVPDRPEDPANLFLIAIAFENRAADFFATNADRHAAGTAEQTLFRELAAEEREHAAMLATEYERWCKGRPGLFTADTGSHSLTEARINAAALLLTGHDGARRALLCGERVVTYDQLRDRVARAAAVWRAHGVRPGDRVAVKVSDGVDWVVAFLGAIWAGGVAVGVNPLVSPAEWQYMLDEAGFARILVEEPEAIPEPWAARLLTVADCRAEVDAATPIEPVLSDPDSPAFWVHSSGTSGKSKAVVHAQRSVREIERISRDGIGVRADDRLFSSSKLFFTYAQVNSLLAGLKLGAAVILDPAWPSAQSIVNTVSRNRPTVLFTVPSLYRSLLHAGQAAVLAKAGVRLFVSAGEPLPDGMREQWRAQTGCSIVNGYGASETLTLVMLSRDGAGFEPAPGVTVQPLRSDGPGLPTRLRIRTSTLALGYLDRPQAQAETFDAGTFCPADLWTRDDAGRWHFAGREDSLVKIRGRWVDLVQLEHELAHDIPDVADSATVCVPDPDGVSAVAFFFVARNGEDVARAVLQRRIDALPPHRRPRWLHAVESLPRTGTGKLLRRQLQAMHEARV